MTEYNSNTETNLSYIKWIYDEQCHNITKMEFLKDCVLDKLITELNTLPCKIPIQITFYNDNKTKKDGKLLNDILNETFGTQKWDIQNIFTCGFERYGYSIPFKNKENNYRLFVPFFHNITKTNIKYAYYGQYQVMIEDKNRNCKILVDSYDVKVIKDYLDNL